MSPIQAYREIWLAAFKDGLRGSGRDWLFAAKGSIAMIATAWLAMRFQLQLPTIAMMTVGIVMHPQSGMVLAKAFYRAIGTVVGSLAGFLLLILFPQQPLLFLLAMAIWIGLCAAGASLHRNFKSYAFVLCGYTAAIVALPELMNPTEAFTATAMRLSEIMLGLMVATMVSDVVFPQRLRDVLRQTLRKQFANLVEFTSNSVAGALDNQTLGELHMRVVREVVEIEGMRSSVVFEHAGILQRNPRLKRLNHCFMVTATTYQSLQHLMNHLQGNAHTQAREGLTLLFKPLAETLRKCMAVENMHERAKALAEGMSELKPVLSEGVRNFQARLHDHVSRQDFDAGAELLTRFMNELRDYGNAYAALFTPGDDKPGQQFDFMRTSDLAGAAVVAVRSISVIAGMSAFWYFTAAPFGAWSLILAAIFSSLIASAPNPFAAIKNMAIGVLGSITSAFILQFLILPHTGGFLLWSASLLPFLLVGFYLYTRPNLPGIGTSYVLMLTMMMMPINSMDYGASNFFSNALTQLTGILGALMGFIVFANIYSSRWLQSRLRRKLLQQVALACRNPLGNELTRFESATRDVLIQIAGLTQPGSDASRILIAAALSVQEIGRTIIELRQLSIQSDRSDLLIKQVLSAVSDLYMSPDTPHYQTALAVINSAIEQTPLGSHEMTHLYLIHFSLLNAEQTLSAYVGNKDILNEVIPNGA